MRCPPRPTSRARRRDVLGTALLARGSTAVHLPLEAAARDRGRKGASATARIAVGDGLALGHRVGGDGPVTVAFLHGNRAGKDRFARAARHLPRDRRIVGIDCRGCGASDRPAATADFASDAVEVHARDMLAALDRLGIDRCHLATHSTSGLIALHMDLMAADRFPRMLALAPVPPGGLAFDAAAMAVFGAMRRDKAVTRRIMAKVAPSI